MSKKPKSIILLSGGLDSTVSATIAKRRTHPLFALTFDYGQLAAKMEIQSSKRICRALEMKHKVIKIPFLKEFRDLLMIRSDKKPSARDFKNVENLWIPNRNALFINIAACYAEYYGATLVISGFNREEAREFPYNKPQFVAAINHSLMYSTLKRVKVRSYVSDYTKRQIYKIGLKYKAPLKYVYACYLGEKKMCGKCASCKRLLKSLR